LIFLIFLITVTFSSCAFVNTLCVTLWFCFYHEGTQSTSQSSTKPIFIQNHINHINHSSDKQQPNFSKVQNFGKGETKKLKKDRPLPGGLLLFCLNHDFQD